MTLFKQLFLLCFNTVV